MASQKIKVLVVEAAHAALRPIVQILTEDPQIEVIGTVDNGAEALKMLQRGQPDVVTVDISLSRTSAFELTRQIMQSNPLPVIIVSASWDLEEVATTFDALEAGAVAVVEKPNGTGGATRNEQARKLVQTVKAMSEVKVVKRWSRSRMTQLGSAAAAPRTRSPSPEIKIVAIGTSTGGPLVLPTILVRLSANFTVPILIVQHIAPGFIKGFADWLTCNTGLPVQIGQHGQVPLAGHAYLAPDHFQMGVNSQGQITLTPGVPINGLCPSIAHLFASVAASFGAHAAGVLLSGMGRDGAEELRLMKQKGALTIAQDRESSVVYGMPGEAVALDAASYVLSPEGIAALLERAVNDRAWNVSPMEPQRVEDSV